MTRAIGIVAFFLAETIGSESAAARSCIIAARALRDTITEIAAGTEVPASARTRYRSHHVHATRRSRYGDRQGTT